jgi:hypothetical protein
MSDDTSPHSIPPTPKASNTASFVFLLAIMFLGTAWTFDMPMALSDP